MFLRARPQPPDEMRGAAQVDIDKKADRVGSGNVSSVLILHPLGALPLVRLMKP